MSHFSVKMFSNTSGAIYPGVPHFVYENLHNPNYVAIPKSLNIIYSSLILILLGFISLCMISLLCIYSRACKSYFISIIINTLMIFLI